LLVIWIDSGDEKSIRENIIGLSIRSNKLGGVNSKG
jgi:hypothetical protein